jgi:hypothetical protein
MNRSTRTSALAVIATGFLLLFSGSASAGAFVPAGSDAGDATISAAPKFFNVWGTCRNGKPFKPPSRHCRYDRAKWFRGTFVMKSFVGKVRMKACFRIFSRPPLGGRHGCGQSRMALKYKAFPFWVRGVRQAFKVRIIWFARTTGKFGKAAVSWMTVKP